MRRLDISLVVRVVVVVMVVVVIIVVIVYNVVRLSLLSGCRVVWLSGFQIRHSEPEIEEVKNLFK